MLTCILACGDHALDTTRAETAGYKDAADIREQAVYGLLRYELGIDPFDIYGATARDAAVLECFYNRDISIM